MKKIIAKEYKELSPADVAHAVKCIVREDAFESMGKLSDDEFRKMEDNAMPNPQSQPVVKESLTTQSHTPTPWKVAKGYNNNLEDSTGCQLGSMATHEDAAFIVRAVNAHAPMVEALKNCIGWITPVMEGFNIDKQSAGYQVLVKAKQALALAEGGK